ncbi:MAG TPA: GGDEF domain-containing protein [Verrucomicrobiae bacterium]|jgi:diguanylate cyclase (GGDEF)-like protein|nr:GGDEF domain-containing protein [Verrucomicrobiae bacterium]
MHVNFKALPALIALAILVAVFAAISRQHSKERVRLWLLGWAFVLLRSVIQFIHPAGPRWFNLDVGMGLGALQLASISFVVSVAPKAATLRRQLVLGALLGIPALTLTFAIIVGVESRLFYYTVVALTLIGTLLLIARWYKRLSAYVIAVSLGMIALAASTVWSIATGNEEFSVHLILGAMNLFAAGLFWYRLHRASAGVLAAVIGFVAWGVFPTILALQKVTSLQVIESEVWNIPKYLVAVGMIVTLLEDQIRWSEHLAYHDALTGLPNRRLVQDRLLQAMAHADRAAHKVAVLLLDLDDFKEVNDTFGHKVGDAALQQVVARLSSRMRASDTLARTGGDEFTVISEVPNHQGAQTLVSALESALVLPLRIDGKLVRTGVSVGYALYPDSGTDPLELYAAADRAMYAAKRGSRAVRSSASGNAAV